MKDEQSRNGPPKRLRAWLDFYDDIGLTPFYLRREPRIREETPATPAPEARAAIPPEPARARVEKPAEPLDPLPVMEAAPASTLSLFGEGSRARKGETLDDIQADLGECERCKLHRHRKTVVFGEGSARSGLVFVGEGPGAEEDAQGRPFVGRAGRLLDAWIEQLGMKREDIYICNVIKCRPPGNRSPEKDEVATCSPFLLRQLDALRPKLLCCLGGVALQTMVGKNLSISRARGRFIDFRGTKLFATFHPAYILRNPPADRQVRQDLRAIRQFLASLSGRQG